MIEALKIIVELLKDATDNALYAFIAYGFFKLTFLSLIVFPTASTIKYLADKIFIGVNNETNKSK